VYACSLSYSACKAHSLYYIHFWPLRVFNIFPHYLTIARFSGGKKMIEHKMCVLILCTTFIWNISRSKKNWTRFDKKCILVFIYSIRNSCQIWMKIEFSRQVFEKYSNVKFYENPSSGRQVVLYRQTDMTKLLVAFYKFANAPKYRQNTHNFLQ